MNTDPSAERDSNRASSLDPGDNIGHGPDQDGSRSPDASNKHERWSKLPKTRGRQPRDPNGQSVRFHCHDVDDLETHLREYLAAPTITAEHATLEFVFPVSSAFMVYAADFKNPTKPVVEGDKPPHRYGKLERTAISAIDALKPTEDPKDQMRRQKAIAKVCVETCEKADGFRYSFHNNWLSREDEACRFSYFCNDSTLNKGRAANEGAGMSGKKMRKPVYNCQGLIAIKFSFTKQSLEVHYKHIPLHKTYAQRAPPPRKTSKRRKLVDDSDLDHILRDQERRSKGSAGAAVPKRHWPSSAIESGIADLSYRSTEPTREDTPRLLVESTGLVQHSDSVPVAGAENSTKSLDSAPEIQSSLKPRRPAIPGTMTGSVQNGHLRWASPSSTNKKSAVRNTRKPHPEPKALTPSVAEPDVSEMHGDSNIPISELEALKQKLAEAEERIKRLESEKSTGPQTGPSHHMPWPHQASPSGYPLPPYPYNSYQPHSPTHAATSQGSPLRLRFQPPPQRPFPAMLDNHQDLVVATRTQGSSSTPPTDHASPSTTTTKKTQTTATQESTYNRTAGTKFFFYTPNAKSKHTQISTEQ